MTGESLELQYRVMEQQDIEWARLLHNEDSTLYQLTDPEHITSAQQESWFRSLSQSTTSKRYVIDAYRQWRPLGPVGIFRADRIDYKNRNVMVGLDIAKSWRGKGLSYKIYEHFLGYYFDQCGMERVYLKVLETNEVARHVYTKLGFQVEGLERHAVFRDGKFRDYICMGMLRDEWVRR